MNAKDTASLRLQARQTSQASPAELSPTELLFACADAGTVPLWEEFIRRFRPVLARAVSTVCRRYGLDPRQDGEDLLQEVFLKLSSNRGEVLRRFVPTTPNSVFPYLRVVAANACLDCLRSRMAAKRGGLETGTGSVTPVENVTDVRASREVHPERQILMRQIDEILVEKLQGRFARRDRSIFWLYYRAGMGVAAIAAIPHFQLGPKGVESVIVRASKMLREMLGKGPLEGKDAGNTFKKGRR